MRGARSATCSRPWLLAGDPSAATTIRLIHLEPRYPYVDSPVSISSPPNKKGGTTQVPPLSVVLVHAVTRRVRVANRLPTAIAARMAMTHADHARAVTEPNAHGLTNRTTATTA